MLSTRLLAHAFQDCHQRAKAYRKTTISGTTFAVTVALTEVFAALERMAPLGFAEPWDNVGLLLEPVPLASAPPVSSALLTIDLTDDVVDEASGLGASLIIAYHPPIFQGLKRLRSSQPGERALLACATRGICIFSPHTALDAAPAGINDWLLDAFGPGTRAPCLPHANDARFGQGRALELPRPITLADAVASIKRHLGLPQVRVAMADGYAGGAAIRRIAVCAGAGGSLFEKLSGFDLYVTGELRHHDVLAKCAAGSSIVLCEHTNTERGFLPLLAARLTAETHGGLTFHVSRCDCDPLSFT
jgi:dinuclear metal center YbgI/SA1388 family protein